MPQVYMYSIIGAHPNSGLTHSAIKKTKKKTKKDCTQLF